MTSALLLLLLSQNGTPSTAQPISELLRIKSTVDQRFEFGLKVEMKITVKEIGPAQVPPAAEPNSMRASFLFAERVLRIEGDHTVTRRYIKALNVEGEGTIGKGIADQFREIDNGQYEAVLDARGAAAGTGAASAPQISGVVGVVFPEAPLSPGHSWEGLYSPNQNIKLRYTFRGVANVGDRRIALIDVAPPSEPPEGLTIAPGSMMSFDLADGRWLRSTMNFSLNQAEAAVEMTYHLARTGAPEWPTILAAFPPKT